MKAMNSVEEYEKVSFHNPNDAFLKVRESLGIEYYKVDLQNQQQQEEEEILDNS
jgi:hypothetical protein